MQCKKPNPDPRQKKLYEKWKVCDKIEETINTCVEKVTDVHNYIDEAKDSTDSRHDLAFVYDEECGKKLHQIHLYTKFFQQPSEITALTLVHEMTHDNSGTIDVKPMKVIPVFDYIKKKYDVNTLGFVSHMMKVYSNEMTEALYSKEVKEECEKSDSNVKNLLDKYKTITPETAESILNKLSDDELDASFELNEIVLCKYISMERACLVEFLPEETANDAECIARFAYDCYKYKQGI